MVVAALSRVRHGHGGEPLPTDAAPPPPPSDPSLAILRGFADQLLTLRIASDGRLAAVSTAAQELLGSPPSALLGLPWQTVLPGLDQGRGTLQPGSLCEIACSLPDGSTRPLLVVLGRGPGPGEIDALAVNLTTHRDRECRGHGVHGVHGMHGMPRRLHAASRGALVGIGEVDRGGRWCEVNACLAGLLDTAPEELRGRRVADTLPLGAADRAGLGRLLAGERATTTIDLPRRPEASGTRWLRVHLSPIHDDGGDGDPKKGAITGLLAIVADINGARRSELEARRMAQIIARTATAVILCDIHGNIVWVNPGFHRLFGHASGDCLGRRPAELLAGPEPAEIASIEYRFSRIASGREAGPLRCATRDGRPLWIALEVQPMIDETTGDTLQMGIAHDITAQVATEAALRRSEARLRGLGDSLPGVLFEIAVDREGAAETRYISAGVTTLRGVAPEAVYADVGLLLGQIEPKQRNELRRQMMTTHGAGETLFYEFPIQRADGERRWIQVSAVLRRDDDGRRIWCGVEVDVTARRLLEEALARAKDEAEAANHAKSLFLAHASHELRTPLGGISGMLEILLDEPLAPAHRERLRIAARSAQWLRELIDDLLDLSQIEAGKLRVDPHPFDLYDEVRQTLETLGGTAHSKGIELLCDIHPLAPRRVIGDVIRFRQVLVNLVSNAIKFTDHGGVSVIVRPTGDSSPQRGDSCGVAIGIIDTGIGIAPERQEAIFAPFEQADRYTNRRFGGTGLGLAISARLVELMGGSIRVLSELGVGAAFWFDLPLLTDDAAGDRPSVGPLTVRGAAGALRALVLDRGPLASKLLARLCSRWQIDATFAGDLGAAREALDSASFDLLILDPDGLGIDIDELLRESRSRGHRGPALLVTASDLSTHLADDPELALLRKPFTPDALLDAITGLLQPPPPPPGPEGPEGMSSPEAAAMTPSPKPPSLATLEPLRVLVAEDNEINQLVAADILRRAGHRVLVVSDGLAAVEADAAETFDVILMDFEMPVLDGLAASRRIRDHEAATQRPPVPIIALTAHASTSDAQRGFSAGMDAHLTKPLQLQPLLRVLHEVGVARPRRAPAPSDARTPAIIDREAVLQRLGGDRQLLRRIVAIYCEQAPVIRDALAAAITNRDLGGVEAQAHRLAGMVANFNAAPAQGVARRLEELARRGSLEGAGDLLCALDDHLNRLVIDLAALSAESDRGELPEDPGNPRSEG